MKQPEDTFTVDFIDDIVEPKKPLKIIFLDFDGVICNPAYSIAMGDTGGVHGLLEPRCCMFVRRLCLETGAKIVVSSSWRQGRDRMWVTDILGAVMPQAARFVFWSEQYPKLWATGTKGSRQQEIQEWLDFARDNFDEEVQSFVILDDDGLVDSRKDVQDKFIHDRLVKTDGYDGMGLHHFFEALAILNNKPRPERFHAD